MPYKIKKRSCTQSDGDKGSYVLSYTSDKGKKYNNCHTSKKKAQGQIAAIEAESVDMQKTRKTVKLGIHEFTLAGNKLIVKKAGKTISESRVPANFNFNEAVFKLAEGLGAVPASFYAKGGVLTEADVDDIDDKEANMDYEDLEDKDLDNDGDEDSSDKYLHHKLSIVNKKAKNEGRLVESMYVVIDTKGNPMGKGNQKQAAMLQKKKGGEKMGYFVIPADKAKDARRALEKARGDYENPKYVEFMRDLYYENVVNESADVIAAMYPKLKPATIKKLTDMVKAAKGDDKKIAKILKQADSLKETRLSEGKDDFVASYKGTVITLKNAYKTIGEAPAEDLYNQLGKLLAPTKAKSVTVVLK